MIVFRALQGFLGGSMIATVFTAAFALFKGPKIVVAAATVGALSSFAPTLGPTVGGWITVNYSWHWLFFVNLVPGAFVAVAVLLLVRIDKPNLSLLRGADHPGMALMAIFLGCLEYTLEEGPRWAGRSTASPARPGRRRSTCGRSRKVSERFARKRKRSRIGRRLDPVRAARAAAGV